MIFIIFYDNFEKAVEQLKPIKSSEDINFCKNAVFVIFFSSGLREGEESYSL